MGVKSSTLIGVTGSTGFIGSQVIKELDRQKISYMSFKGDLCKPSDIGKFFKESNVSTVINLVGSMSGSFADLLSINVQTTQNLLEIGVHYGLKKIIFTSTGAVYKGEKGLARETDILEPTTFYGLSKVFAEKVIRFYQDEYDVAGVILRLPNVYGSGNEKNVIAKMLSSIKREKKVYVAGDGKQRRQFLSVEDAARAVVDSLAISGSQILNITNEEDNYSIAELANFMKKYFHCSIEKIPADNNLKNLLMSGSKSKKNLSFIAKNSLVHFLQSQV